MNTIQVFEPALCCATGVCGEDVDQSLVTFSADLDFVRSQGGDIRRYNLASEPLAFAETEAVKGFLQVVGSKGLPLVLVNGIAAMTGGYPDRARLAEWAGLSVPAEGGGAQAPAGTRMLGLSAAGAASGVSGTSPGQRPQTEGCCSGSSSETAGCC